MMLQLTSREPKIGDKVYQLPYNFEFTKECLGTIENIRKNEYGPHWYLGIRWDNYLNEVNIAEYLSEDFVFAE